MGIIQSAEGPTKRLQKKEIVPFFPPPPVSSLTAWARISHFISCPWAGIYTIGSSGSQLLGLRLDYTTVFLGLQAADGRLGDFAASVTTEANFSFHTHPID